MAEVLGAATAIGMAAMTAKLGIHLGGSWARIRDELRFSESDRHDIHGRFQRIVGDRRHR